MLLADMVDTVEVVTATRSRLAKIAALAELLGALDPAEVVPVVGLLRAQPRQGRLGVGWRGLAAVVAPQADAATADPGGGGAAGIGVTVADLDAAFDGLAMASGAGSAGVRSRILADLSGRTTPAEWDLVTRVIRGELRTGALEGVLTDAIARAAGRPVDAVRRAAMLSGDLGETALIALTGGDLDAVSLVVGRAVQPMLAGSAATVSEAVVAVGGGEVTGDVAVEYKLDGARIQVHRTGDEVHVFTRNLADITHRVPEIVAVARGLAVEAVILDGETLSLDEDGGPRPFQETMARFGADAARESEVPETVLRPWFFDVLHLDGRDLIDEPLAVRREELARVAAAWTVPSVTTRDPEASEAFARAALADGHEGVMVKALDAPYAAGRRGRGWVKVKPVLTFDLVVLGVERGSGRREGLLSNLHLGALDREGDFGEPGGFVMVGKTFKGLTDELLRWQTEWFPTIQTRESGYTLFVRPETVVEIAIDGVQRSPRYPGGIALRFARVKGYRPDKRAEEADTIHTLRQLLRG